MDNEEIGSYVVGKRTEYKKQHPRSNLRDRIISFVVENYASGKKIQKGDIFARVSASGSAGQIVSSLITTGVFIEKPLECGNCKYLVPDMTKINIE